MEPERRVPVELLSHVHRGAIVTVKDEEDREYRARVVRVDGRTALVRIFEELALPTEPALAITLVQAVPKRERMELIVEKATELGVSRIVPCTSARSVIPGKTARGQDKSHRWPAIAERAVRQCRRRLVPVIAPFGDFLEAVRNLEGQGGLKLLLYEKEQARRLGDVMEAAPSIPHEVVIACGPEGGFTPEEALYAEGQGFVPVRLGGRVLRCETAALAALSIIQHEWGDL